MSEDQELKNCPFCGQMWFKCGRRAIDSVIEVDLYLHSGDCVLSGKMMSADEINTRHQDPNLISRKEVIEKLEQENSFCSHGSGTRRTLLRIIKIIKEIK